MNYLDEESRKYEKRIGLEEKVIERFKLNNSIRKICRELKGRDIAMTTKEVEWIIREYIDKLENEVASKAAGILLKEWEGK